METAAAAAAAATACEPPEEAATARAAAASKSVILLLLLLLVSSEEMAPPVAVQLPTAAPTPPTPICLILLASSGLRPFSEKLFASCSVLAILGDVTGEVVAELDVPTVELDFFSFGGVEKVAEEAISFEKADVEEETCEEPLLPLGEARSR